MKKEPKCYCELIEGKCIFCRDKDIIQQAKQEELDLLIKFVKENRKCGDKLLDYLAFYISDRKIELNKKHGVE